MPSTLQRLRAALSGGLRGRALAVPALQAVLSPLTTARVCAAVLCRLRNGATAVHAIKAILLPLPPARVCAALRGGVQGRALAVPGLQAILSLLLVAPRAPIWAAGSWPGCSMVPILPVMRLAPSLAAVRPAPVPAAVPALAQLVPATLRRPSVPLSVWAGWPPPARPVPGLATAPRTSAAPFEGAPATPVRGVKPVAATILLLCNVLAARLPAHALRDCQLTC